MLYSLYVRCPLCSDSPVRKVDVIFIQANKTIFFNQCDFSNAALDCSACKQFCTSFILEHPEEPHQKGTTAHPLSF